MGYLSPSKVLMSYDSLSLSLQGTVCPSSKGAMAVELTELMALSNRCSSKYNYHELMIIVMTDDRSK